MNIQKISKNYHHESEEQVTTDKLVIGVMNVNWATILCGRTLRNTHFKMRITLGVVFVHSLVCA